MSSSKLIWHMHCIHMRLQAFMLTNLAPTQTQREARSMLQTAALHARPPQTVRRHGSSEALVLRSRPRRPARHDRVPRKFAVTVPFLLLRTRNDSHPLPPRAHFYGRGYDSAEA